MNIYVAINLDEAERALLEKHTTGEMLLYGKELPDGRRSQAFREAEVAFGNVPAHWLEESDRLRWLQLESVGYDPYQSLDRALLRRRLTITNLGDMFGIPVAETALAGILCFCRGLDTLLDLQQTKTWRATALRSQLRILHGARIVILGSGSIGQTLRDMLLAFSCHITLMGRTSPEADIYTLEELDAVLPEADVVVCCLPDAPETRGLFEGRRLALLKSSALFVNVGRGSVVDETALIDALQSGRLGGCVLDVTRQEPLPADDSLWDCPNTILTQHTGGGSESETEQKVHLFLENLARYRNGGPLRHVVSL